MGIVGLDEDMRKVSFRTFRQTAAEVRLQGAGCLAGHPADGRAFRSRG